MTRIPSHTVEYAPDASRTLLQKMIQFSAVFTAYFLNYAGTELDLPART